MSDEHIEKIRKDLRLIPPEHDVIFQPFKLSEPFLEKRLTTILSSFWRDHPHWQFQIITNGSVYNDRVMSELANLVSLGMRLKIKISLNSTDPREYEKLMGLRYDLIRKNIARFVNFANTHKKLKIVITRVSTSPKMDADFLCETKAYGSSNISASFLRLNTWLDEVIVSSNSNLDLEIAKEYPCDRWFDLSILSNGDVALCCMDGDGKYKMGNAFTRNALDVYRGKVSLYVTGYGSRKSTKDPCASCSYMQGISGVVRPLSLTETREIYS